MKTSKHFLLTAIFLSVTLLVQAQPPEGYYNSAFGKKQAALKTAMQLIINDHDERSYADLWSDFYTTDQKSGGQVWDMYSNCNFTFFSAQCGNYSGICDCYNREHSMPQSWFSGAGPMYTDLFHLYPTDGYTNNRRGNDPFGEVGSASWTGNNGSKVGNSSFAGYTGRVFEPAGDYKGDFARTYFYMVTCYENVVAGWYGNAEAKPMLNGTAYPAFQTWAINLLLKWSREDPVSEKEIERNNAVFGIQHNRNPFIDFPELAEYIWGNNMTDAFYPQSGIDDEYLPPVRMYVSNDRLQIENLYGGGTVSVYNIYGQLLSQTATNAETLSVPVSGDMILIVRIADNSGRVSTYKIFGK